MTRGWEPGVQYNLGDTVDYEHRQYRIIQPHFSQGDWTPDRTPALWGLIPVDDCDDAYQGRNQGRFDEQKQQPWNDQQHQTVPIQQDERKKSWNDFTPERKKELEVGGGLVAGLALLGAGYAAYHHHEQSEDNKKAAIWGAQNWLHDAQTRTQRFYQDGPQSPVTWVLVHGQQIPEGAIQGGEVNGNAIFIARAFYDGGLQVGKCSSEFTKGAVLGYGHKEIEFDTYEVLLGDSSAIQWVDVRGKLNVQELGVTPVEAGREADGTPLFVAQALVEGGTHCGKVSEKLKNAFIAAGGKEVEVDNYRLLSYS